MNNNPIASNTPCRIHLTVDSSKIVYINMILDSYEGIAILRTADENLGEILLYSVEANLISIKELIADLVSDGINISINKIDYIDKIY